MIYIIITRWSSWHLRGTPQFLINLQNSEKSFNGCDDLKSDRNVATLSEIAVKRCIFMRHRSATAKPFTCMSMHKYACVCLRACVCVCSCCCCCVAMWTRIRLPHPHCPHGSYTPRTRLPVVCLPHLPAPLPSACCYIRMQIWCKNMWNFRF